MSWHGKILPSHSMSAFNIAKCLHVINYCMSNRSIRYIVCHKRFFNGTVYMKLPGRLIISWANTISYILITLCTILYLV